MIDNYRTADRLFYFGWAITLIIFVIGSYVDEYHNWMFGALAFGALVMCIGNHLWIRTFQKSGGTRT